jgi:hypothetical protein
LNAITKEAWNASQQTEDNREKIQALSLAKECYSMKLDLLTNATVVDDAIRFVSEKAVADSNVESKADGHVIIEEEGEQQEDNNRREQKSDNNTTTVNQVF